MRQRLHFRHRRGLKVVIRSLALLLVLLVSLPAVGWAASPTSTPTPISLASPGVLILEVGTPGHTNQVTDVESNGANGFACTLECCTAGTACVSGCSILSFNEALSRAHHTSLIGLTCPSALLDICYACTTAINGSALVQ